MSSKGFLIYASGKEFVTQAYLCALSIRASGNKYPVSIVTNDKLSAKYKKVFDKVVDIPWYEETTSRFQTEHRWKNYHATPYDETIVLEADMMFTSDITHWWKELAKRELFVVSNVRTYRDEVVTNRFYRKTFDANELPNLYSALHYFKKGDTAKEFYNLLEIIVNNWALFYSKYAPNEYQKWCSIDVSMAIASKILGNEKDITDPNSFITFTHMKPLVQGWYNKPEKWTKVTGKYFTEGKLFLGNYLQSRVLHYVEDEFLTDELLEKMENGTTLLP